MENESKILNEKISSIRCEIQFLKETITEHNQNAVNRSKDILKCFEPLTKSVGILTDKIGSIELGCAGSKKEHEIFIQHIEDSKIESKERRNMNVAVVIACIGWAITLILFFIKWKI